jgi:ABC-type Zn uptake system ZnuABC Zn-binding protein ZnuA
MKKTLISIIIIISTIVLISGCSILGDRLEGSTIYVTNYPIKYLVETFYNNHAKIVSIYPSDADTKTYQLTDKQIKDYSKGSLFVYNGLSEEKKLAKEFLTKNKNILIADVSYGLSIEYSVEELWLSPNNYLMLAKNVRESFREYLNNKTVKAEIEKKYEELAENLSLMDADLRSIGDYAKSKNKDVILVSNKAYKFLENYGFNVVCLEDENYKNDAGITAAKNNYKNGKYTVLIYESKDDLEIISSLLELDNNRGITLSRMTNGIPTDDYLNIMQQFINALRNRVSN